MAAPRGGSVALKVLSLQRRQRVNGQRVYVRFEQIRDGGIHQAVTGQGCEAAEGSGDDLDAKMAASVRGAGVSGMQVALVHDVEKGGGKTAFEPLPQSSLPIHIRIHIRHQARSGVAGLILPLSQSACGITNTIVAPVIPNTLKFTQTFSAKFCAM